VSKLKLWLWIFFGSALLGLGGLCLVGLFVPDPPGVTKKNFKRVQKGMTEQEVEQIFGFPGANTTWGKGEKAKVWLEQKEGRYGVYVVFDSNGKVAEATLWPLSNVPR
jgi:hypothetical protein